MAQVINPKFTAFDSNGDPLSGGKLTTHEAGTSTPKTTYSDPAMGTPNTNPVVLSIRGEAAIYGTGLYKLILTTSLDAAVWTVDNVSVSATDDIADTDGDTKIQTEESSDEDIIRFDCAGQEQAQLHDGKLIPTTDNDLALGDATHAFSVIYALTLRGLIRGLEVSYKDADEIYVSGGAIHINDGSNDLFYLANAQITKQLTGLTINKMRYIYVDPPASGLTIATADIEHDGTAPTYDHAKKGWYHPTTTDWRFIGSVPIDGSGDIMKGYRSEDGHAYFLDGDHALKTGFQTATFTDIEGIADSCPNIADALAIIEFYLIADAGAARQLAIRTNGATDAAGWALACVSAASGYDSVIVRIPVDVGGKVEWKVSDVNAEGQCWALGYWEPR